MVIVPHFFLFVLHLLSNRSLGRKYLTAKMAHGNSPHFQTTKFLTEGLTIHFVKMFLKEMVTTTPIVNELQMVASKEELSIQKRRVECASVV